MTNAKERIFEGTIKARFDIEEKVCNTILGSCKNADWSESEIGDIENAYLEYIDAKFDFLQENGEFPSLEELREILPDNKYIPLLVALLSHFPKGSQEEAIKYLLQKGWEYAHKKD